MKVAIERKENKVTPGATKQLVQSRQPPSQLGQKYERWKIGVEKWYNNNKATDEEKYIDLLESLKNNKVIKEFVVKTLVENIGETK